MHRRTAFLVAAFAIATLIRSPAQALVIDDFEAGAFSLTTALLMGETAVQSGLPPANVLGGQREVTVRGGGTSTATAELALTPGPDSLMFSKPSLRSGSLNLRWTLDVAGVDLTQGGTSDRFLLSIPAVDDNVRVVLAASDTGSLGFAPHPGVTVSAAGAVSFLFSDFGTTTALDFTHIDGIEISIAPGTFNTSLEVSELVTVPEPSSVLLLAGALVGLGIRRRAVPR